MTTAIQPTERALVISQYGEASEIISLAKRMKALGLGPRQQKGKGSRQNNCRKAPDQQGLGHFAIGQQTSENWFSRPFNIYVMRGLFWT